MLFKLFLLGVLGFAAFVLKVFVVIPFGYFPASLTARLLHHGGTGVAVLTGLAALGIGGMAIRPFLRLSPWPKWTGLCGAVYLIWLGAAILVMTLIWTSWHDAPGQATHGSRSHGRQGFSCV